MRNSIFDAGKSAFDVVADRLVPFVVLDRFDRTDRAQNAGIGEQRIDPAVSFDDPVQRFAVLGGHRDVDGQRERFASGGFDLGARALDELRIAVDQGDFRAFLREQQGGGAADAGSCSGDDRYFSVHASVRLIG